MSIRPLHDRVVIKRIDNETTSTGGIIIPDNAKEKPITAKVVAIGTGKPLANGEIRPLSVKVDDTVIIGKYSGTEVKIAGEEHFVLREDEILGILEA